MLGTSFVLWLPLLMEGASLQAGCSSCFPRRARRFEDKVGNAAWYRAKKKKKSFSKGTRPARPIFVNQGRGGVD